jgi:hypothetical protein
MDSVNDHRYYNPSRRLYDYDGVPLRSKALPHPVTLSAWMNQGWIRIDAEHDRLVLTDAGREVAASLEVPS